MNGNQFLPAIEHGGNLVSNQWYHCVNKGAITTVPQSVMSFIDLRSYLRTCLGWSLFFILFPPTGTLFVVGLKDFYKKKQYKVTKGESG